MSYLVVVVVVVVVVVFNLLVFVAVLGAYHFSNGA